MQHTYPHTRIYVHIFSDNDQKQIYATHMRMKISFTCTVYVYSFRVGSSHFRCFLSTLLSL